MHPLSWSGKPFLIWCLPLNGGLDSLPFLGFSAVITSRVGTLGFLAGSVSRT